MSDSKMVEAVQPVIPANETVIRARLRILEKIASTLNVEPILQQIVETTADFSGADKAAIFLLDDTSNELYIHSSSGFNRDDANSYRQSAVGTSMIGRVFSTGRPTLIEHTPASQQSAKIKLDFPATSVINLPIRHGETIYGVLGLYINGSPRTFVHKHMQVLIPFADYTAIAIENMQRYKGTNQLLSDTYALFDIAGLFTETRDLNELLDLIASLTLSRLDVADRAIIHLLDVKTGRLEYQVRVPPPKNGMNSPSGFAIGEGVAGRVLQENQPINIGLVQDDPFFVSRGVTFGSLMVAPISWRNNCVGTISVASQHSKAFNYRNERFLSSLANLAAIAIENARLYEQQVHLYEESQDRLVQLERHNRELNSLRDILGVLQSTLSLSEVLAQIVNGVVLGLNYRAVMLSTIDDEHQVLTARDLAFEPIVAQSDLQDQAEKLVGQKLIGSSVSLKEHRSNLGVQVCLNGEAQITHNLHNVFRPILDAEKSETIQTMFGLQTLAIMPIKAEDQLFGILYAGTERGDIDPRQLDALKAFANQAAIAIRNARQFEHMHQRLRRRVKELQSFQDIDRLISSTADQPKMLDSILDMGLKLVDADCGNIALVDKRSGDLIPRACYPQDSINLSIYDQGLTMWVAQSRLTTRVRDLARTRWENTYLKQAVRSELAAPILVGDDLVGVINIGSTQFNAFSQEDESLLDILATQTAVAIQMTEYYQELEKSQERSNEAERIAAMSDMASNMVHNINNSVGAIRVLVQQIRFKQNYNSLTPDFLEKKLEAIERSAEKTLDMARNIRNPFQKLATEPTDVNTSIHKALDSLETKPSTLEIILELDEQIPEILATQQLVEVFRNLIENAVQAMRGAGILHLSSRLLGQYIEVSVADNGPGITHDLNETSVFNLGVSSKTDGLGYGLWWCKIYLNRVGGTIDLDRSVTTGCRFLIYLPLPDQPEGNQ